MILVTVVACEGGEGKRVGLGRVAMGGCRGAVGVSLRTGGFSFGDLRVFMGSNRPPFLAEGLKLLPLLCMWRNCCVFLLEEKGIKEMTASLHEKETQKNKKKTKNCCIVNNTCQNMNYIHTIHQKPDKTNQDDSG